MYTDPNRKFNKIADDAANVVNAAHSVEVLFQEARFDGITAYRESRIKLLTKQVEAGAKRLRRAVQTYDPTILSKCDHCGHTEWRDD